MKMIAALALMTIVLQVATKHVIWDEQISHDRLVKRVEKFNEWYKKLNPSTKVSAKVKGEEILLVSDKQLNVKIANNLV